MEEDDERRTAYRRVKASVNELNTDNRKNRHILKFSWVGRDLLGFGDGAETFGTGCLRTHAMNVRK